MSDVFGAVGQVAGASIQANAMRDATQMQIDALQKQRDFVYSQLEPGTVNAQAQQADIDRAKNQLALQGQIDPALLAQRYASEGAIAKTSAALASGNTPADQVAATAAKEAVAGTPGEDDAKKALVDAALKELAAGATLPPDVQAQLVQTGLQKTGQVTGAANASGVGGQVLSTILGTAGINLKMQREQQAANLTNAAKPATEKYQRAARRVATEQRDGPERRPRRQRRNEFVACARGCYEPVSPGVRECGSPRGRGTGSNLGQRRREYCAVCG
jgi:hypothetical protein